MWGKDTTSHNNQKKLFLEYLKENTATCSMVTEATGIPQKCLRRYKIELQKQGILIEVFTTKCRITGFRAAYLSTNTALIKSILRYRKID